MNLLNIKKLRISFCLVACGIALILPAQNQSPLSGDQWREDLRYLQTAVHSKFSNLFYNVTEKQFDSAITAIDRKIGRLDDIKMRAEFVKLVAMFKVGHTNVRQRYTSGPNQVLWIHPIPVRFYLFPEGLFIRSIDEKYKDAIGGKLIRIGNTGVNDALEKIKPFIAFENEQGYKSMLPFYLSATELLYAAGIIDQPGIVPIVYEKNGREIKMDIEPGTTTVQAAHGPTNDNTKWIDAVENGPVPLWQKNPGRLRYFEYLPAAKTVYVRHSAVQNEQDETLEQFFAKVFHFIDSADVDKFILDIRMNGGGNNYLNKPVITGVIASKKINRKGHFFVITGKATFSAAQNLTNELEKYTEVIFAGEPTSENVNFYGDTKTEVLPNSGLNVNLSWLWWQNHDPRDKRKWTAPELAVDMSFDDYKNGRDPVVDYIMQYKEQDPIDKQLANLISNGKQQDALDLAKKYLEDPVHRYYREDTENKINNSGYVLMNQNKLKEANELLGLNVQLFPSSANAYDSYAESWWKLGNIQEAVKNYKIAISKDPGGPTGDNSRAMLKQIEEKKGF